MIGSCEAFDALFSEIDEEETFREKRPLLAHYTSLEVVQSIIANNEFWFSNPLLMNDLEEVMYGLKEARSLVIGSDIIRKTFNKAESADIFFKNFDDYFFEFEKSNAFDVYVFCMSIHDKSDNDGLLSMWRGYGGHGNGAAIVIDTGQLEDLEKSPFIMSKVHYVDKVERKSWIENKLTILADILIKSSFKDEELYCPAYYLFERLKLFALFTKHKGFSEENEWRIVYLPDRDINNALKPMLDYTIGKKGIEPKLKLKLQPLEGVLPSGVELANIVSKIILGPTISDALAKKSFERMLEKLGRSELKDKVVSSGIPLRPT